MMRVKVKRRPGGETFVEEFLRVAGRSLGGSFVTRLKEAVRDGLREVARKLTTGTVGVSMLVAATVFLLVAGVEGLKAASLPAWAAYLILGVVALLGGGILPLFLLARGG
jgi:hypothetical protein